MVMVSTTREGERSAWSCLASSATPASIITLTTNTAVIVAPAAARVAQTQQPRRRLARSLPLAAVVRESVVAGRWRQQAGAQQGGCTAASLSRHTATKLQLLSRSDPPPPDEEAKVWKGRVTPDTPHCTGWQLALCRRRRRGNAGCSALPADFHQPAVSHAAPSPPRLLLPTRLSGKVIVPLLP